MSEYIAIHKDFKHSVTYFYKYIKKRYGGFYCKIIIR